MSMRISAASERWKIDFIRNFMVIIGPISSIFDFLTFAILLCGFHAFITRALFHTGWFVESLATQTLVVLHHPHGSQSI